jgi:hypothetical protein
MIAALMMQDAEQVQRGGVLGIAGDDLLIERRGLIEPSGFMQFNGGVQNVGHGRVDYTRD